MLTYSSIHQTVLTESEIGAKAFNLDRMTRAGFMVPTWCVVCTSAFTDHIRDKITGITLSEISAKIQSISLSDELQNSIIEEMERCGLKQGKFAVRSSSLGEDGIDASFAGQLDSFLYVSQGEIFEAVKRVWGSAFSPHALEYFHRVNRSPDSIKVGVIIQEMVDSDVSGVAFSLDPVSGNRRACVISAVYGLGEGLVSGYLDADMYTMVPRKGNTETFEIITKIVTKTQAVRFNVDSGKGTSFEPVPVELQNVPALNSRQIETVVNAVRKLATISGRPQDIEWAYCNDKLYILQSRPVTTLKAMPDRTQLRRIWDNSNIIESYPGVTTPLTFSFVHDIYSEVYKQFCRIMGVEERVVAANGDIFSMVGLIKGRIYYNLLNWYKVLSLLPGYSINADFMEQMMGVKERLDIPPGVVKSKRNGYLQILLLVASCTKNLITLKGRTRRFYNHFNETIRPFDTVTLSNMSPQELIDVFRILEKALLSRWDAPLVNDFFAMIFFGILKKIVAGSFTNKNDNLHNDLLCGEGGVISTEPIMSICAIAGKILDNSIVHGIFVAETDAEIIARLGLDPNNARESCAPEITAAIREHLERFGDRCAGELKLETVTPQMDPGLLVRIIRFYIAQGGLDPAAMRKNETAVRTSAERKVLAALRKKPLRRLLFSIILSQTRSRIRDRENLRFERTRLFAVIRNLFCNIGKRFTEENIIGNERDIFYLTKQEIFGLIEGITVSGEYRKIIELRKAEYERFINEYLPDRFETFGALCVGNTFVAAPKTSVETAPDTICGTGCCAGIVTARIHIVTDPSSAGDLRDSILVAERTDPGWAPLFPLAKGLLVERGSLLSHSAIVAREMGIPAIIGIDGLISHLTEGQCVEMDGSTGIIRLLTSAVKEEQRSI